MKFSVPTNWQNDLISNIRKDCVDELYGKLASDVVGGGRASFTVPYVSKRQVVRHIEEAHRNGLKFNYLLNATCLDNLEWTISGQRRIRRLLDWLITIKVDAVTVAIPYLLELIKNKCPQLKVYVSSNAGVNSIERAKYWEDLGADRITLLNTDVNRNFPLLKKIRENVKCELQLVPNDPCLNECHFNAYHANISSHGSQSLHLSRGFIIDYCWTSCRYMRFLNPAAIIRSKWIRPEDVHYYKEIGIDRFKLVDRGLTTIAISLIVNAYVNRNYKGNLLDLISDPSRSLILQGLHLGHKIRYFFRPLSINIFRFLKIRKTLAKVKIYIDNQALGDFLEYFLQNDCSLTSCHDCGYCEEVARRIVRFDKQSLNCVVDRYRDYLFDVILGRIFKYL